MPEYTLSELFLIQQFVSEKCREYNAAGLVPTLNLLLDDIARQLPQPE